MNLKQLESISLMAWPALQEKTYDGWILRFSEGYTKRANSINSFHPSTLPLAEKVSHCEKIYKERHLPPIFRITTFSSPPDLDSYLKARGYQKIDPTSVLTHHLADLKIQRSLQGDLISAPLESWLDSFCRFLDDPVEAHQTHRKILQAIPSPKIFALLLLEDQPVACGVGAFVEKYIGLFDLLTHPDHRGKGHGTSLVLQMLRWAQERDAQLAYLQVVEANQTAMRLYRKLGFKRAYHYWYRRL
jgi:GNAT superfamily N-acetyltransferase